jgi:hypothetical protein
VIQVILSFGMKADMAPVCLGSKMAFTGPRDITSSSVHATLGMETKLQI